MATTIVVTAKEMKIVFRNHIYMLHGIPLNSINDKDAIFMGIFWQNLHYLLGT